MYFREMKLFCQPLLTDCYKRDTIQKMKGGDMSPQDRMLRVRLTDEEYKMLEEETKKAGFYTLSEFVRYMTIGEGRAIDEKLETIIKKLDKK